MPKIYQATVNDINALIQLRLDFLRTESALSTTDVDILTKQLTNYFTKHLPTGDFIAIIAKIENNIASTAFLAINERPATPAFMTGITGTLLNVFTYPQYRRQGIAECVIKEIIREAEKMGVSSIDLSATPDGKALYEKLGFQPSDYFAMRLKMQTIQNA